MVAALDALRPLLAEQGIALAHATTGEPAGPGERRLAQAMLPFRRREFLAGRRALRQALAAAGCPAGEILYATGRRPRLPAGAAGSLTHSGGLAVALAAGTRRFRALGCDLELRGLPLAAAHLVLGEDERAWAEGSASVLHAAFSAKEAAFKAFGALLPAGRAPTTLLGLAARPVQHGFLVWPRGLPGSAVPVRVHRAGDHGVFSWVAVAAAGRPGDGLPVRAAGRRSAPPR
uniref:4'-phosphopantetheinyl transferase n=1 Tax=Streptomyces orinoci TaxID=67339 RepID=A0A348AZ43_STRON|nr:4'-phosphopantetheinyl transferase [Streptomyces orinoci]